MSHMLWEDTDFESKNELEFKSVYDRFTSALKPQLVSVLKNVTDETEINHFFISFNASKIDADFDNPESGSSGKLPALKVLVIPYIIFQKKDGTKYDSDKNSFIAAINNKYLNPIVNSAKHILEEDLKETGFRLYFEFGSSEDGHLTIYIVGRGNMSVESFSHEFGVSTVSFEEGLTVSETDIDMLLKDGDDISLDPVLKVNEVSLDERQRNYLYDIFKKTLVAYNTENESNKLDPISIGEYEKYRADGIGTDKEFEDSETVQHGSDEDNKVSRKFQVTDINGCRCIIQKIVSSFKTPEKEYVSERIHSVYASTYCASKKSIVHIQFYKPVYREATTEGFLFFGKGELGIGATDLRKVKPGPGCIIMTQAKGSPIFYATRFPDDWANMFLSPLIGLNIGEIMKNVYYAYQKISGDWDAVTVRLLEEFKMKQKFLDLYNKSFFDLSATGSVRKTVSGLCNEHYTYMLTPFLYNAVVIAEIYTLRAQSLKDNQPAESRLISLYMCMMNGATSEFGFTKIASLDFTEKYGYKPSYCPTVFGKMLKESKPVSNIQDSMFKSDNIGRDLMSMSVASNKKPFDKNYAVGLDVISGKIKTEAVDNTMSKSLFNDVFDSRKKLSTVFEHVRKETANPDTRGRLDLWYLNFQDNKKLTENTVDLGLCVFEEDIPDKYTELFKNAVNQICEESGNIKTVHIIPKEHIGRSGHKTTSVVFVGELN